MNFSGIGGISRLTILDFPGRTAAILWYNSCNAHCPYCYNPDVVKARRMVDPAEVAEFLRRRKGVLDGVVLSGGECTLRGPELVEDARELRRMGYAVKLDTNGTNPGVVRAMLDAGLLDFVALDCKCPRRDWARFFPSEAVWERHIETLDLLAASGVPFETRTTIHPSVTSEDDLREILEAVKARGCTKHAVQFFFTGPDVRYLDPSLGVPDRIFDLSKAAVEGVEIVVRNPDGNA